MANKKISELTSYTTPISGDVLPINDTVSSQTKKVTIDNLFNVLSSLFRIKDSSDTTKKVAFDVSGVTTSTTRTITIPDANTTMVGTDVTQTLSNKTLTSPKITVGSDANGDLHYTSNANGTQSRLAIGSNNKILRVVAGLPAWSDETATIDASTTVKGVVEAATSAELASGTSTGSTGAVLVVTPDIVVFSEFGSGADGSLTYDGSTTILGMAPSSSIYTLTRDIYGTTITVNNGVTIETAGYRIFASTSLINNGTIKRTPNNGGNASGTTGGTAGTALSNGTIYGGLAGKTGANGASSSGGPTNGVSGVSGDNQTESIGVNGVAGGAGGSISGASAGSAGSAGSITATLQHIYNVTFATIMREFQGETLKYIKSAAGSGSGGSGGGYSGGGSYTSGAGGGSGSTGGIVWISARVLTNTGTISANGGNGGNGSNATSFGGGGGGGAGGSGGTVILIYKSITLGTVTVTGGTGGTGGTGANGGTSGGNGGTGNTGTIIQIAC